jgi:hypothetical protein
MDQGLTAKLKFGALHCAMGVLEKNHPKLKVTAICRRMDRQVLLIANSHNAANKNDVELGGRGAFKRFKHSFQTSQARCDGLNFRGKTH